MRSKILQRILDKTPREVEICVDKYVDMILRINQKNCTLKLNKMETLSDYEKRLEKVIDEIRKLNTLEAIVLLDKFITTRVEEIVNQVK